MRKEKTTRNTDKAFLQLMKISGKSFLKLLGVSPEKAERYHFQTVTFQEKPEIECIVMLVSEKQLVFIEFQAYPEPFSRYRLAAAIFQGCAQQKHKGEVIAGIIYTAPECQAAALPFETLKIGDTQCLNAWFREIVLSDYTEDELRTMDPKLLVLAPFTLSAKDEKANLLMMLMKGREWREEVRQIFPLSQQQEILDILGFFVLKRFRQIKREEVNAMLNFDMMETVAGKQLYNQGVQKGFQTGLQEGSLEEMRENVLEVLDARFGVVAFELIEQIRAISQRTDLKSILRQATLCPDWENFKEILSKIAHSNTHTSISSIGETPHHYSEN